MISVVHLGSLRRSSTAMERSKLPSSTPNCAAMAFLATAGTSSRVRARVLTPGIPSTLTINQPPVPYAARTVYRIRDATAENYRPFANLPRDCHPRASLRHPAPSPWANRSWLSNPPPVRPSTQADLIDAWRNAHRAVPLPGSLPSGVARRLWCTYEGSLRFR